MPILREHPHRQPIPSTARGSQSAYGHGLKPAEPRACLHCLHLPPAQAIDALESRFGVDSPFDSVCKLSAIVRRAHEPPQIAWCFCSLADKVLSGAYACADFSLRALVGDASSGNKGQVDVFIFRMSLVRYYMGLALLERLEPSLQMRKKCWDVFESHTAYGANLTPIRRGAENRPVLEGKMAEVHGFLLRMG